MTSGILRKFIFYFFLLANLTKSGIAAEFTKIEDDKINPINPLTWSKEPLLPKQTPIKFFSNKKDKDPRDNNQIIDNVKEISKSLQLPYDNENDE